MTQHCLIKRETELILVRGWVQAITMDPIGCHTITTNRWRLGYFRLSYESSLLNIYILRYRQRTRKTAKAGSRSWRATLWTIVDEVARTKQVVDEIKQDPTRWNWLTCRQWCGPDVDVVYSDQGMICYHLQMARDGICKLCIVCDGSYLWGCCEMDGLMDKCVGV